MPALLEQYWTDKRQHLASPGTARQSIDRLIEVFTGTVADLTPAALRGYYTNGRPVKATTKARELTVLRAALIHAAKEGWIDAAPAVPVIAPAPPRERWLTRSEAARLLWETRHIRHLALFIRLALYTGARAGAILDLQWSQVDLARGRIDYNPPGRRQTDKMRPVVAIGPRLRHSLWAARKRAPAALHVISWRGSRVERVKTAFRRAAAAAGLPGVTPHTLRHTAATWMAQAGIPLTLIAGVLGQSIARTTERYIKQSPDYQAGAAAALERGKVLGRNDRAG